MKRHLYPALALITLSCHSPRSAAVSPLDLISALEYDLFASAILAETAVIFTPDSTTPFFCSSTGITDSRFGDDCGRLSTMTEPVAWGSFLALNLSAFPLSSEALRRRGLQLKGPPPAWGEGTCPAGPATVRLSRAAFNADSSLALLRLSIFAGRGASFNGCGYSGGTLALYERTTGGQWKKSRVYSDWQS